MTINAASVAADVEEVRRRTAQLAAVDPLAQVDESEWIEVLKTARKAQRLTQGEVAERMDASQSMVSSIENGARTPSLPTLVRYAAAVGYELEIRLKPLAKAAA